MISSLFYEIFFEGLDFAQSLQQKSQHVTFIGMLAIDIEPYSYQEIFYEAKSGPLDYHDANHFFNMNDNKYAVIQTITTTSATLSDSSQQRFSCG